MTVLGLLILVPAERRMGVTRTLTVLLASQPPGALLAAGLLTAAGLAREPWLSGMTGETTVGALPGVLGTGFALSCTLTPLWRRRLRLLLTAAVTISVLYLGHLEQVAQACGAAAGLLTMAVLTGRARPWAGRRASAREVRVLVAMLVAVSALGGMLAALAADPDGPMSLFSFLITTPGPDPHALAICSNSGLAVACRGLREQQPFYAQWPGMLVQAAPGLLLLLAADGLRRGRRLAWWLAVVINLTPCSAPASGPPARPGPAPRRSQRPGGDAAACRDADGAGGHPAPLRPDRWPPSCPEADRRPGRRGGRELRGVPAARLPAPGPLQPAPGTRCAGPGSADAVPSPPAARQQLPVGGPGRQRGLRVGFPAVLDRGARRAHRVLPAHPRLPRPRRGRRARAILTRGGSTLSYMSTWQGNQYWFSPDGRAAVAYRAIGAVAVTVGEPYGDPAALDSAITGFAAYCEHRGLQPCLYSVTAQARAVTQRLGWKSVQIAEDTLLPLEHLQFTGKKWQDVRTALNKAAKEGITAQWQSYPQAPPDLAAQIRQISQTWMADKGLPEMGFTLGGLDELNDPDIRCLIAVGADGTVHGITSWMPVYASGRPVGWTLDFMRRNTDPGTLRGVMEFLIATAATAFREEGAHFVSLSGAPLARLDRGERPTVLQRLLDKIANTMEPVYGFRSLLHFKAKFQPLYQPLYLAYPDPAALGSIAAAIGRAYLPHLTSRQALYLLTKLLRPHPNLGRLAAP